jgi:hypothetical protein
MVDADTAIVFGTATFRFAVDGKDDEVSAARYTTTYIRREGRQVRVLPARDRHVPE